MTSNYPAHLKRQDKLDEAICLVNFLQCMLCETDKDHITIPADGLYNTLECVLSRLKEASA